MFVCASACASVHPSIPRILTLALFLSDPAATPSPRGGGLPQGWGKGLRGVSPREGLCPPPPCSFFTCSLGRGVYAVLSATPTLHKHTHTLSRREREREEAVASVFCHSSRPRPDTTTTQCGRPEGGSGSLNANAGHSTQTTKTKTGKFEDN